MRAIDTSLGERRRRRAPFVRLARTVIWLIFAGVVLVGGGFLWFLWQVPSEEVTLNRRADGIVVLTGGSSRIADAVDLLAKGHGRRLLISGVHRKTSQAEISRLVPEHQNMLACCVDLDYSAVNTTGNAAETRRWVKDRGFRSLIVVTSNYHMPRAMAELGHQLPDVVLIPFPVIPDKSRGDWSPSATARLLILEYLKYIVALARMSV
jgi:uncharacterized SAM-binding protein YcdF (DUF218 family)